MSNNKIFKISNIYMLLCGIDWWDESIEIRGGRDYRYLALCCVSTYPIEILGNIYQGLRS
jgi:hypothetical protein